MNKYYFIKTYGCQMNVYDSGKLVEVLESLGYQSVSEEYQNTSTSERENQKSKYQKADIILVNTCCVREHAENRTFGFISSLKNLKQQNPNLIIGVCGCLPKEEGIDLQKKFPFLDLIFGPNEPEKLTEFFSSSTKASLWSPFSIFDGEGRKIPSLRSGEGGPRASEASRVVGEGYVTIMHGCDNFCSYCIVPYVRGREISRSIPEVLDEIGKLIEQGATDITLLGQNVNSYQSGLANLLQEIGKLTTHNSQLTTHFMTSHPRDMSDEIIKTVYELPYLAKEFHLPLQSGDDEILEKMNRGYTADYYRNLVTKIRSLIPDARITTDVIVGFPGETEEQFENTLNLIREIKFNAVNMAAYSLRLQTAAAKMNDHLPEEVKQERLQKINKVVKEMIKCYNPKVLEK